MNNTMSFEKLRDTHKCLVSLNGVSYTLVIVNTVKRRIIHLSHTLEEQNPKLFREAAKIYEPKLRTEEIEGEGINSYLLPLPQ